jgi:hypothetical protein
MKKWARSEPTFYRKDTYYANGKAVGEISGIVRNCIGSYRVINSPAPWVRKFVKETDELDRNRPL